MVWTQANSCHVTVLTRETVDQFNQENSRIDCHGLQVFENNVSSYLWKSISTHDNQSFWTSSMLEIALVIDLTYSNLFCISYFPFFPGCMISPIKSALHIYFDDDCLIQTFSSNLYYNLPWLSFSHLSIHFKQLPIPCLLISLCLLSVLPWRMSWSPASVLWTLLLQMHEWTSL